MKINFRKLTVEQRVARWQRRNEAKRFIGAFILWLTGATLFMAFMFWITYGRQTP